MNEGVLFLTIAEVVDIHRDQIDRYGGHPGIRNNELLCSAVGGPEITFDGNYLNSDLLDMAAAYILYICQDHPFVDGNKRTALATGLVFLELNGVSIMDEEGCLYNALMDVAAGKMRKSKIADLLRELSEQE